MPPKPSNKTTHEPKQAFAAELLHRAHSPNTAQRIYDDKIKYKPLPLHRPVQPAPATSKPHVTKAKSSINARTARQRTRSDVHASTLAARRKARKGRRTPLPAPLSAAEKRELGLHAVPKEERKYALYEGLNRLWQGYMREILGLDKKRAEDVVSVTRDFAGPKIASADLHGALVTVVRARCVSRVGIKGIVVRDGKFAFKVITKDDKVLTIPKEHTVFRIEVSLVDPKGESRVNGAEEKVTTSGQVQDPAPLVFELQGSQIANRAAERATKKFKMHIPHDL